MTGPTPSPESPAVQDTDRLRVLAVDARMPAYRAARDWAAQHGHPQPDDRMIGAALAAVLPVHREMVLGEAATAIEAHVVPREDTSWGAARRNWFDGAAALVRRLAVSAPPTPPGSPPADEQATAVETGRVERPFVPCELGVAGDWCALPIEHAGSCNATVAVPGIGDDPPSIQDEALAEQYAEDDDEGYEPFVASEGWTEEPAAATIDPPGTFKLRRRSPEDQALYSTTKLIKVMAERDRLALDLQARDIAVREADRLREQVEAERDRAVLALGDLRGREALLVAERDDARESAASILNDAGELAETIRRYEPVIEAARVLSAAAWNSTAPRTPIFQALLHAIAALGDIPSPTAPEARICGWCGNDDHMNCDWDEHVPPHRCTCPCPSSAEPEGTPDA